MEQLLVKNYLPIFLQIAFATLFVFGTIWVSQLLGPRRRTQKKNINFECGIDSIGDARSPFSIKYFLVAILFVLFDIEVVFMYPWAINFKTFEWAGVVKMLIFLGILEIGYLYIAKRKAFDWGR